ncbi:glycoside hydrolase family 26 protein [Actinocorallia longicatena]|uniref:GH26 domain-containing protein n=1 Tax=Actinocorallia longicatena TaxID=111803 RepID=A0ABP6QPJ8_9ACTN
MTSIRPLLVMALPAVLAAACASPTPAPKAAPAAPKATASVDSGSGRTESTDPGYEPQSKASDDAGAPKASVAGGAKATAKKKAAAKKAVYNNKMPKNFTRYNAPGAYNVNKLLYPRREIVGVFTKDNSGGTPISRANALGKKIGKKPNMIKTFVNWGGGFDINWAQSVWRNGSIPQFELELRTFDITMRDIAKGEQDDYIRQLAVAIRAANVPVTFSPFHEFNGDWYEWGWCGEYKADYNACKQNPRNTPSDFKGAWKRMHNIFRAMGATNAIWLWQANQIGARPKVPLKPFWPGSSYVDWVGVVGYYQDPAKKWISSFEKIFRPTFVQVRKFTKKPILIPEVGSWVGKRRNTDIKDFLAGVARYPNVIGFIWFNEKKVGTNETDWRIEWSQSSVNTFKASLKKGAFGFNPKHPTWPSGK